MGSDNKAVIFLAYSNDRVEASQYLRNLVAETREIRASFEAKASNDIDVEVRGNANLDDILKVFDQFPSDIQVFHFAGHADELKLLLENKQGGTAPINAEAFNKLLVQQPNLKLVFLNGCSTWAQAKSLAEMGMGAVIATSSAINDRAAYLFASRFYERLAEGASVIKAFEAAQIKAEIAIGNARSMYWEEDVASDEFPWKLFGKDTEWALKRSQQDNLAGNLLPLMCDREAQVEAFVDHVEQIVIGASHQPHFYMIHGSRKDKHRSLVTRLRDVEIRYNIERAFGKEVGIIDFLNVVDWPSTGDLEMRKRNLLRNIARTKDFPGLRRRESAWKANEFIQLQRGRRGAVVLQHTISGDQWDTNTYKLIDWYINIFWNLSMEEEMPQFVIFLNVIYPEEKGSFLGRLVGLVTTRADIQRELEAIAQKSQDRCKVLTELNPISYSDVSGWVAKYFPDDLIELPMELFEGNTRKNLSMDVVESKLKEEVERLERERWLSNE